MIEILMAAETDADRLRREQGVRDEYTETDLEDANVIALARERARRRVEGSRG